MTKDYALFLLNQLYVGASVEAMPIIPQSELSQALSVAIKALEQQPILDKIRAEIEKAVWEDVIVSLDGTDEVRIPCFNPDDVFEIIDKYKIGSD